MTAPLTPLGEAIQKAGHAAQYANADSTVGYINPEVFAAELDRLGYVVVPKEPTEEIEQIIQDAVDNCETAAYIYRATIAAAPRIMEDRNGR